MSGTLRALTIALRVDAGGMGPGFQQGAEAYHAFKERLGSIGKEIAAKDKELREYSAQAAAGGHAGWAQQGIEDAVKVKTVERNVLQARQEATRMMAAEAHTKANLDDTYFRSTHTNLQVQLRDRQMFYARLRTAHASSASTLLAIDRTQAAEEARIMQDAGGGKMLGGRAAKRVAKMFGADVLGMISPELGQASGYGMMAGMAGAGVGTVAAIGGVALAAVGISEGYKAAKEHAMSILRTQQELNAALSVAKSLLYDTPPTTPRGQLIEQGSKDLVAARDKAVDELAMMQKQLDSTWGLHPIEAVQRATGASNIWADRDAKLKQVQALDRAIGERVVPTIQAQEQERGRMVELNNLAIRRAEIEGMANGPIKERALFGQKMYEEMHAVEIRNQDPHGGGDLIGPRVALQKAQQAAFDVAQARSEEERVAKSTASADEARMRNRFRGESLALQTILHRQRVEEDEYTRVGRSDKDREQMRIKYTLEYDTAVKDQARTLLETSQDRQMEMEILLGTKRHVDDLIQKEERRLKLTTLSAEERKKELAEVRVLSDTQQAVALRTPREQFRRAWDEIKDNPKATGLEKALWLQQHLPKEDVGRFTDTRSWLREIQTGVMQPEKMGEMTLKEITLMRRVMEQLFAEWQKGLALKGG